MTTAPQFSGDSPLHVQVRELIRQQAISGEIVDENGRLMTEAALVERFGVSRVTVRNALAPLVEDGMFDRSPKRGTFLRPNYAERWVGRLMGFQEIMAEAGYRPGAAILQNGMTHQHDDEVRELLKERAVYELKRIRYADDTPIAIEHAFYPPDIGIELSKRELISIKMYQVFEEDLGLEIKDAVQTISARISTAEDEAALELDKASALIEMQRTTHGPEGRVLELLRAVYRPDFFQLTINLSRRGF